MEARQGWEGESFNRPLEKGMNWRLRQKHTTEMVHIVLVELGVILPQHVAAPAINIGKIKL